MRSSSLQAGRRDLSIGNKTTRLQSWSPLFVLACAVLVGACDAKTETGDVRSAQQEPLAVENFGEAFEKTYQVTLMAPDTAPVVRVSGIDVDGRGRILIGDVSEGNVKFFGRDGTLLRIFGRKGDGPGEFIQPRFPRFQSDSSIVVVDGQNGRETTYLLDGTLLDTRSVGEYAFVMDFELFGSGHSAITAVDIGQRTTAVHILSPGSVVSDLLTVDRLGPALQPANPSWKSVTQYWLAIDHDTAYVVSTLSDSIWTFELPNGAIESTSLSFSGYATPILPSEQVRGPSNFRDWLKQFHVAATIGADDGVIAVPFVKGVLNYGDSMTVLVRQSTGSWGAYDGAPPVIGVARGQLITLEHPDSAQVTLGFYEKRS